MVGKIKKRKPIGRSIPIAVGSNNSDVKQEIQNMKKELLEEFAKMLQALQLVGNVTTMAAGQVDPDLDQPVFIPSKIGTGDNKEVEINIKESENMADIDEAIKSLKQALQGKKKGSE